MKRAMFAFGVGALSMVMIAGPAEAFSTAAVRPIRGIPVNARNYRNGVPGAWASGAVYTRCGAIGVEAVFLNNSSGPHVNTGRQTYSISIQVEHGGVWQQVKGSEVRSYRPSRQHERYEFDRYVHGWPYKYRVLVQNRTSAPLLGTMWVNAAANDNNPANHDLADCQ